MTEVDRDVAERMLAGLVVGTRWRDTDQDREIWIRSAREASEHGLDFVELHLVGGGDITADTFFTMVETGLYEPLTSDADDAKLFMNRYVGTETER